jgi:hypothetical protein
MLLNVKRNWISGLNILSFFYSICKRISECLIIKHTAMKTMYTLLTTALILTATLTVSAAERNDNDRGERTRSEKKASSENVRRSEKKAAGFGKQRRESSSKDRVARDENRKVSEDLHNRNDIGGSEINSRQNVRGGSEINRSQSDRRGENVNRERDERRGADINRNPGNRNDNIFDRDRNDHRDMQVNRDPFPYNRRDNRMSGHDRDRHFYSGLAWHNGIRFRNDHEFCRICFGLGYLLTHDRLHRVRCHSCYGRGFAMGYGNDLLEYCPLCYSQLMVGGNSYARSIEEIARIETDRLSVMLDLSDRQANRIYRINLHYMRNRHRDIDYAMQERDKDILDILNSRQQDMYLSYIESVDSRDLCDRCYALR